MRRQQRRTADEPAAASTAEREAAVAAGEQALRLREEDLELREKSLRAREEAALARGDASMAQLREANERLVVATVNAEQMNEATGAAFARVSHIAEHDVLTGLPNRAVFSDRLVLSIALAQRHGKNLAVMFLDIDHFKYVNDTFGHAVGDELLQLTAKRMQGGLRNSDTVCRQGGDEFVVLLTEIERPADVAVIAGKLRDAMTEPYIIDSHRLCITASIGISVFPDDGEDGDALLENADLAMYHAKKGGRNNYRRFTRDMSAPAVPRTHAP